jgi:hypothetical protein
MITLSFVLLVWTLINWGTFPTDLWFRIGEGVLSAVMVLDISGRAYVTGIKRYFKQLSNVFDFLIVVFCMCLVLLDVHQGFYGEIAGVSGDILFAVRNVFMLLRLVYLVKNQ